jgi:cell division septation protein DedD
MGQMIRRGAAADDIAADGNKTLANAEAKGGVWKKHADERLGPTMLLINKIDGDIEATDALLITLQADVDAYDAVTDDDLGFKADEMWNKIGRPAFDAAYALVWPGGYSAYAEGSDEEQPDRMDLLAELLDACLHPKLDPVWCKAMATDVRARAATYRDKYNPLKAARTKAKLLGKARNTLARAVQMDLARLKRLYRAEGFSEAEIHQVIPHHPRPTSKEAKPAEAKPAEAKPAEAKPTEAKPTEAKPTEAKPTEAKPTEVKPTEVKPTEAPPLTLGEKLNTAPQQP